MLSLLCSGEKDKSWKEKWKNGRNEGESTLTFNLLSNLLYITWRVKSHHPSPKISQPRMTQYEQQWTNVCIEYVDQWIAIMTNLHWHYSHLPWILGWCPSCNKNCTWEMVPFLSKNGESDQINLQDYLRSCGDQGDGGETGVATVIFMDHVMRRQRQQRQRQWWRGLPWWGEILWLFWLMSKLLYFVRYAMQCQMEDCSTSLSWIMSCPIV